MSAELHPSIRAGMKSLVSVLTAAYESAMIDSFIIEARKDHTITLTIQKSDIEEFTIFPDSYLIQDSDPKANTKKLIKSMLMKIDLRDRRDTE